MVNTSTLFPLGVQGLKRWDPSKFQRKLKVPFVKISEKDLNNYTQELKKYMIKRPAFNAIVSLDERTKMILLHPDKMSTFKDSALFQKLKLDSTEIVLTLENYSPEEILKMVLPSEEGLKAFSSIGHIAHVNLKEHLLEYKDMIGQILLLHPRVQTVLNKTNSISSTFRNFTFELLAGKEEYCVSVKETGIKFEFDFSKVYWNPRLSTEHERIVEKISPNIDYVYDVFAGVGPFVLPLAKRKSPAKIFANDLNPDSYHWLKHNKTLNKISSHLEIYNLEGRQFITNVIVKELEKIGNGNGNERHHIIMNLPALAIDFLDAFSELLTQENLPNIVFYVYTFSDTSNKDDDVILRIKNVWNFDSENIKVDHVRKVAPKKAMLRVTITLSKDFKSSKRVKLN